MDLERQRRGRRPDAGHNARHATRLAPTRVVERATERRLAALMHQQCWCWGCDIRRAAGNLLIEWGADRVPPPSRGGEQSSAYHVRTATGAWLGLWGFGIAVIPPEGPAVFLNRYAVAPAITDAEAIRSVWHPRDLPVCRPDGSLRSWWAASHALYWIATYESWVAETAGASWRRACSEAWKGSVVAGDELAHAWHSMALEITRQLVRAALADGRPDGVADARLASCGSDLRSCTCTDHSSAIPRGKAESKPTLSAHDPSGE